MNKQSGFTLVEIAIVMVIIGLLLGGVLKGQEIITNAKVKNLENDITGLTAAIYSYQDRYRYLPGDDKKATRFGSIGVGDGDRTIENDFYSTTTTHESYLVWSHLRNAGLITGEISDATQPENAFGGLTGVSMADSVLTSFPTGRVPFVGFTDLPKDIAIIIDARSDDGNPKTGNVRGLKEKADGSPDAATTDYTADVLYYMYISL